jgi:hypothetical protein
VRGLLPAALVPGLLLAAPAARADSFLDRPAPDPVVAKWVAGEAPPAWKDLAGRCALLELTDPDDLVCQGLASRTAEVAAKAGARRMVLVSVAVGSGADEGTAKEFAGRFKVTWPLGVDRKGETLMAAGMPSLPRYFLVAPDGRVLWEGSPGALDEKTLDAFAEKARIWRTAELSQRIRPAALLFVQGKYAAALRKAEEALAEVEKRKKATLPLEGTEEKDAALLKEAVRSLGEVRLVVAGRLEKDRWSLDALEMYEGMAAAFAGCDVEAKAKEALERMAKDERAQAEILAGRKLREIVAKLKRPTRFKVRQAIEAIDNLLVPYGNLQTGERLRAERARLEKLLEKL